MTAELRVPPPRAAGARAARAAVAPAAIVGLATVLVLFRLAAKSMWLDEAISVGHAREPVRPFLHVLGGGDANMSLYYVLLHLWVPLAGEAEAPVRALSALLGVLAVGAVYLLGERLFGRATGLVAALLLAVNAFFVRYAQEARGYSLVLLLVTLASYFFVAELERPSRAMRAAYVATASLAVYAHYFALYVLLVHLVVVVALQGRAALARRWLLTAGAVAALCAPALAIAVRAGAGQVSWIAPPTRASVRNALVELAGGSPELLVLLALACCWAAFAVTDRWRVRFVAAWLLVPTGLALCLSFVQPMFLSKYLIVVLPALALLAAAGAVSIPGRLRAATLVGFVVVLSAFRLGEWYGRAPQADWRGAIGFVVRNEHPGDGIVYVAGSGRPPSEYYQRRHRREALVPLAPSDVSRARPVAPRVWLVESYAGGPELGQVRASLGAAYRLALTRRFAAVGVELYVGRRPDGAETAARSGAAARPARGHSRSAAARNLDRRAS